MSRLTVHSVVLILAAALPLLAACHAFYVRVAPMMVAETTCDGDMDCELQCVAELRPDEDNSICEVEL